MERFLIIMMLLCSFVFSRTVELKDGTVIDGSVISEDENTLTIKTSYATLIIEKSKIKIKNHKVILNSGETFIGEIIDESQDILTLKTSIGEISLSRSNIKDIEEVNSFDLNKKNNLSELLDFDILDKDKDFSSAELKLTDLFFYPTGNTFNRSDFYVSGLSFGFGITDRFMMTSKWTRFFIGDFNVRLKYKLLSTGNIDKGSSLSIGVHPHTRWSSSKGSFGDIISNKTFEWREGTITGTKYSFEEITFNSSDGGINEYMCQVAEPTEGTFYYGDYFGLTDEVISLNTATPEAYNYNPSNVFDTTSFSMDTVVNGAPTGCYTYVRNYEPTLRVESSPVPMVELFGAYTYYSSRAKNRGQISHTLGGSLTIANPGKDQKIAPRVYYGFDVDISPKLKYIFIASYDPRYLELYQIYDIYNGLDDDISCDSNSGLTCVSESSIEKFGNPSPFHFDIGFFYAITSKFRVGIHFQDPWIGFYWKL